MNNLQCIVGKDFIPFGQISVSLLLHDYADGVDTLQFLDRTCMNIQKSSFILKS